LLVPLASLGWAIPLLIVAQALIGFSALVYNINQVSLRQSITPQQMQGRMNATMRFIVWGTIPIGATLGGIIATSMGVTQALWIGSILGCTTFLPVFLGPVRRLREFPSAPHEEPSAEVTREAGATEDPATEAALSGYEPMGISHPGSLEALSERSREKGGDPRSE
jgi:MFS family permease